MSNVPGRQDAGRVWMTRYDKLFAAQGFSQSIVDRRVFFKRLAGGKIFIVAVYVDDNWTVCDDDDVWETFHTAWKREFVESANVVAAADDFCGVNDRLARRFCRHVKQEAAALHAGLDRRVPAAGTHRHAYARRLASANA